MSTLITRGRVLALVGLGVLLLAGFATAAQPEPGTITACYEKYGGAIRIVRSDARCRRGERKLSWNTVGPAGVNGVNGTNGTNGTNGINGTNGVNGTTGFTSTLPVGKTEKGTYALSRTASVGLPAWEGVSFVIPLAAAISVEYVSFIAPSGPATLNCPGSSEDPQAASGHLCVYEAANFNTPGPLVFNPDVAGGGEGAGPFGFALRLKPTNAALDWGGFGTWAVTG